MPSPAEAGARLKYGIKELCIRQGKLTQSYHKLEQGRETENPRDERQGWEEWEGYQRTLW